MVDEVTEHLVRKLADRQEIADCLLRYTRGVDRHDRALMLSSYHQDAIDDHGVVVLRAEKFVDWALDFHRTHQVSHYHVIANSSVELDGDTAHAETYYMFFGENREGPNTLAFGRYIDRLEKRNGKWGIVRRQCLTEAVQDLHNSALPEAYRAALMSNGPSKRDQDDLSYQQPLEVARAQTF